MSAQAARTSPFTAGSITIYDAQSWRSSACVQQFAGHRGPRAIQPSTVWGRVFAAALFVAEIGVYDSVFGYSNSSTSTVSIPIGTNNEFTGVASDGSTISQDIGQPTTFAPGTNSNAFVATPGKAQWDLNGSSDKVPSKSTCSSDPVPIVGPNLPTLAFGSLPVVGVGLTAPHRIGKTATCGARCVYA